MRQIQHAMLAVACVACLVAAPAAIAADSQPVYQIDHLPLLDGMSSAGNSINNRGWITGFSSVEGGTAVHATLWRNRVPTDLGTLGGANSNVAWPVKNNSGLISGFAETDQIDPLGESWSCSAFFPSVTGHTCLGFVWRDDVMKALPTLGGNNGFATGSNNRGQVVGWAENAVHDPTCVAPQVLQFQAVVWGPEEGKVKQLLSLPLDSTSAATAINDKGQVVGISGICDRAVGRFSAKHMVLWENDTVTDLGNLGGVAWNTPMSINQQGDVIGFANYPGGATPGSFRAHAFLWTRDSGIQDLGTLPGHVYSQALGINARRQVVGMSCSAGFAICHAFLWQDGVMTDLNDAAPGYSGELIFANDINDLGQITGGAFDAGTGESPAFVAVPVSDGTAAASAARAKGTRATQALSNEARQALLKQFGVREDDLDL